MLQDPLNVSNTCSIHEEKHLNDKKFYIIFINDICLIETNLNYVFSC